MPNKATREEVISFTGTEDQDQRRAFEAVGADRYLAVIKAAVQYYDKDGIKRPRVHIDATLKEGEDTADTYAKRHVFGDVYIVANSAATQPGMNGRLNGILRGFGEAPLSGEAISATIVATRIADTLNGSTAVISVSVEEGQLADEDDPDGDRKPDRNRIDRYLPASNWKVDNESF